MTQSLASLGSESATVPGRTQILSRPWIRWPAIALGIWLFAKAGGVYLERTHRREFLSDLSIAPTRAALASDSALEAHVRESVLSMVPVGSDTLAVASYAQRLGALNHLSRVGSGLGLPNSPMDRVWLRFPERARWYEFGVCDWDRVLEFHLDATSKVREVAAMRVGACL